MLLLVLLLARFFNYIPEAGLWMNTQRPEWNDANNALVTAVEECFGPDSPLIQELGGYDYSLPSDADVPPGLNAWYNDFLEDERE